MIYYTILCLCSKRTAGLGKGKKCGAARVFLFMCSAHMSSQKSGNKRFCASFFVHVSFFSRLLIVRRAKSIEALMPHAGKIDALDLNRRIKPRASEAVRCSEVKTTIEVTVT